MLGFWMPFSVLFILVKQQMAGKANTAQQECHNEWWNNSLLVLVNQTWCVKVKEVTPELTGSSISLQHKAALQAAFSFATGCIQPNKRETERKFHLIPADKKVLFQQLISFLLRKCVRIQIGSKGNLFFSFLPFFLCIWGSFLVPISWDKAGWQSESLED